MRDIPLALAAVVTTAVLAACGGGDSTSDTAAQPAAAAQAGFGPADVSFAQQMIPHHSQAVKMASLAAGRAKDPKVKALAAQIASSQGPEIETMQGLLQRWNQPLVADMADMDHSSMSPQEMAAMSGEMPGMATDPDLAKLSAAKGAAFDRMFLALMLEHHRGAVQMARAEREAGRDPQALGLAEDIETAQTKEIARMERLAKS